MPILFSTLACAFCRYAVVGTARFSAKESLKRLNVAVRDILSCVLRPCSYSA